MYKIGFLSGGTFKIQPKIICGNFEKYLKIVKIQKCKLFNLKYQKFWEEN